MKKTELTEDWILNKAHKASIPICGVYFLIWKKKIIYVGQSCDILSRIRNHERNKKFDQYNFIRCQEKNLDRIEADYIIKFNPKYNRIITSKHSLKYISIKQIKEIYPNLNKTIILLLLESVILPMNSKHYIYYPRNPTCNIIADFCKWGWKEYNLLPDSLLVHHVRSYYQNKQGE